jgi:hypothetical protein
MYDFTDVTSNIQRARTVVEINRQEQLARMLKWCPTCWAVLCIADSRPLVEKRNLENTTLARK